MKKFFCAFLTVAMFVAFSFNNAYAINFQKFIAINEEIRKEFLKYENDTDLRDFEFLFKVELIQLKSWNSAVSNEQSEREKIEISQYYIAILGAQFISMQEYLEVCVVGKSQAPQATRQKYAKLIKLVAEGVETLK